MNAADVMDSVVARLVDAIEAGAADWQMPWRSLGSTGWPTNAATGNRYSGGNVLALYLAAIDHGYPTARWATYKQWQALGAQVRKGERGTLGIFWKVTDPDADDNDERDDTDEQTPRRRSAWARAFTVFNAAQVDNDPAAPTAAADARPARPRRPSRSVLRRHARRRPLGRREPVLPAGRRRRASCPRSTPSTARPTPTAPSPTIR